MAEATLKLLMLGEDRTAGKALRSVGGEADKTKGRLSGLAKVGAVAVAGAFVVLGRAAINAGKAAAEDEAAQRKLANTMRNAAGASDAQVASTESWITAQGKALGVTDDELRPALGRLVAATHNVGQAQKDAALAMDVSAGTGKSLEAVSTALAKAHNGNIGALGRLGVATKNADGSTKSLDQITKELADTYKGSAATAADTVAGKQKRAQVAMQEFREEIGSHLLPIMGQLATAGAAMIAWIDQNQSVIVPLVAVIGTLAVAIWAINAAGRAYAATQAAINLVMALNPIGLVIVAIAALVAAFVIAYKKSETFRSIIDTVWSVLKKVGSFIATVFIGYLKLLGVAWLTMGIIAIGALKLLLKAAFAVFDGILSAAEKGMGWIPGIGGKIKDARRHFRDFGDSTIGKLNDVQGALINTRGKVIALGKSKARPTIDTGSIDRANAHLDALLGKLKKASGGLLNLSPHALTGGKAPGKNAVGTRNWTGGMTWVGERGPELVNLPRGSQIHTAGESARMMGVGGIADGTITLVVKSAETGETIEQKLIKVKRTSGRSRLGFELVTP